MDWRVTADEFHSHTAGRMFDFISHGADRRAGVLSSMAVMQWRRRST
jgi:hypothetical protein